ncbi:MAG: hypothetical protein ACETWE_10385 [Candidatus Bathyarchaeia archaeon]
MTIREDAISLLFTRRRYCGGYDNLTEVAKIGKGDGNSLVASLKGETSAQ